MKNAWKVHLALFTVSLIYGGTFTIAKEVMPAFVKPYAFITLRVSTAAVLFLVFHFFFIREKIKSYKDILPFIICSFFGASTNMLLFFKGLDNTTPINAAVLMMATPIFVAIFAPLLAKERIPLYKIGGLLTASVGAILLIGGRKLNFSTQSLFGDLLVTINAMLFAVYLVYAKRMILRYHPITVSKWSFVFGIMFVLPFGYGEITQVKWDSIPAAIWASILFVVVGSTFITYLLNAWALKHTTSSMVGTYIYLQPVMATVIALFAGKDQLTIEKVLFILLIFAGVYIVSYQPKKNKIIAA